MRNYVKEAHTAIFSGPTSCGKTQRVLDLIEKEYKHHFENIVILCPTVRLNKTSKDLERSWIWKDDYVFVFEPKETFLNSLKSCPSRFQAKRLYSL